MFVSRYLILSILSILIMVYGCGTDTDNSVNPISDISEIDVELETNSYDESSLSEITSKYNLGPGIYKMRVNQALICQGMYIYFQGNDTRIYLETPINSYVSKHQTILGKYTSGVVVEIINSDSLRINPCTGKEFGGDIPDDTYMGSMIGVFDRIR